MRRKARQMGASQPAENWPERWTRPFDLFGGADKVMALNLKKHIWNVWVAKRCNCCNFCNSSRGRRAKGHQGIGVFQYGSRVQQPLLHELTHWKSMKSHYSLYKTWKISRFIQGIMRRWGISITWLTEEVNGRKNAKKGNSSDTPLPLWKMGEWFCFFQTPIFWPLYERPKNRRLNGELKIPCFS